MVIANPIYDVVFKYLMEDERIAKFFIGTLLNETVEEVKFSPQEYSYVSKFSDPDPEIQSEAKALFQERLSIAVFRVDFIATIRTEKGEVKKVLVEIQKAKNVLDIMRFRNYVAEHYKKEDVIDGKKISLPIITIYLLGFNLPDIESAVLKVSRQYVDLVTNKILEKKSEFIEKLTHDCYVVQLERIESRVQTKLDKLLSVFEQKYFVDDNNTTKLYNYKIDDEDVKVIIDKLHYAGTEPEEKKKIENEKEALRVFAVFSEELRSQLEESQKENAAKDKVLMEKDKTLNEKDKALIEKDQTIYEKDKTIDEKDKTIDEKDKTLLEKDKIIEELKRKLSNKE